MFFCRHQLLRAPAQRHFSNLFTIPHTRHLLIPLSTHSQTTPYARSSSSLPGQGATSQPSRPHPTSGETKIKIWPPSPVKDPHPPREVDEAQEGNGEDKTTSPETVPPAEFQNNLRSDGTTLKGTAENFTEKGEHISAYLTARKTHGHETLLHLSSSAFRDIAWDVVNCKRHDVMEQLVADAAYILRIRRNACRYPATFLLEELGQRRDLRKRHMLTLMRALREHSRLRDIRFKSSIEIALGILKSDDVDKAADDELLVMLQNWLSPKLRADTTDPHTNKFEQAGSKASNVKVPLVTWPLFRVLLALAQRGKQTEASELMRQLIESQSVHTAAIEKTDLTANDYVYVVLSVLVRTCIQYGWFSRATSLLVPVVSARRKFSRPLARLVQDWLQASLDEPRDVDLTDAAAMIIMHFQRAEGIVIHDTLLQRFYKEAAETNAGELAQAAYRHSREVTYFAYNPPGGSALVWFIRYLRGVRRDVHLSRVLTKHIAEGKVNVVPFARAPVLYNAAAHSFTRDARALWERWSEGPDRKYVVASSATMLRFVSAFMNTEATMLRAANQNQPGTTAPIRINSPDRTEREADEDANAVQQKARQMASHDLTEETNPASDAPHSSSPPPPHDNAVQPPSSEGADLPAPPPEPSSSSERASDEREDSVRIGTAGLTREQLLARAADVRRFTEHVFDTFYELKQPFETANRMTINAVARGAFMLGRDQLAFEMFNLMRNRGMRLDLHDLNVIISVVAKADPEKGIERIQKMIDTGLEPDAVTYGTVIHWAIFHGQAALVKRVIDMAREHGLTNFSFKTLAALLHATVSAEFLPEAPGSEQLDTVQDILTTMLDLGIIPTPNVGWDCVKAALAAEDPGTAFRFWKVLLKDKVEFADMAQRLQRRRIGTQIQEHFDAGWLGENQARVMLSELGFEIFSLHDRRRLAAKEKMLPGMDKQQAALGG